MTEQQQPLAVTHPNVPGAALQAEQARLLYAGIPVSLGMNALIALILVSVQRSVLDIGPIIAWCTLLGATLVLRSVFAVAYRHAQKDDLASKPWLTRFRVGTTTTGIAWGLASYLLLPANDIPHQFFLVFAIAGMTAGAVTALSIDLASSLLFIIPALVPLIARLLAEGGEIPVAMGVMGTLYLVALTLNSRRTYISIRENICLRLEAVTRENVMRKNEENLHLAQTIGQIGSWVLDIPNRGLEWSTETYRMFDIQPNEVIDQEIFVAATHPDDRDFVMNAWADAIAGDTPFDIEHRIVVGGQTRWVRECARIERDSQGRPLTGIGTVQDITERKQMEQEILRINAGLEERVRERTKELEQVQRDTSAMLRRYKTLMMTSMDGIHIMDMQGNIVEANDTFCNMLGYTRQEVLGLNVADWEAQLSGEELRARFKTLIGKSNLFETLHRRKNGTLINVEVSVNGLEMEGLGLLFATSHDITARKQAEAELRIAASAFETQEGMVITDIRGVILRVNHAFTVITGYTEKEAIGQTMQLLKSGRQDDAYYAEMWINILSIGVWKDEIWNRRKNGEVYPEYQTITAVRGENGAITHFVVTLQDITERKAAEEEVKNLAFYDTLTQLPNRRLLDDRLGKAIAASKRSGHYGAVMFLDLDNFKQLNDIHGHRAGDLLLVEVAHRLARCVREIDTVARFGGDEFVVVLNELNENKAECAAQASVLADKIRAALAEPYWLTFNSEGSTKMIVNHHCAASIGVVLFNGQVSSENVLRWADRAMYQAKEAGQNLIRFYDSND